MSKVFFIRAETPKMMIAEYAKKPGKMLIQFKEAAGVEASVSFENARNVSDEITKFIKFVMEKSTLSPEEKMLMLKAIHQ